MTVALLLIHDGRHDYLERTLASAQENLPDFDQRIVIDDTDHRLGFAGAVKAAWDQVETDWVFHLEADFTFNEPVDARGMIGLLERHPRLAQVSLKRQAVNHEERAAGGIVELHPNDFDDCTDGQTTFTTHRRYWTTNPSVYSSRYCRMGWPQVPQSEGIFTHQLLRDQELRFAIWGAKFDPPRVHHIGDERAGHGY